jgi:fibronectin-binding autotransporter adhesin
MKLKFSVLICALCAFAAASAYGQTIYTWVGTTYGGNGTNITTAANWTTNGTAPAVSLPSGANGDTAQWDNQTLGPVLSTYNNGLPGTGFGTIGINLIVTANQTNSVDLAPRGGTTGNIGISGININSATAAFSIGDTSANILNFIGRPAGAVHDWVNNSAVAATIYPNVRWQAGGGAVYTIELDGTGNWLVTNHLANANGTGILIEKAGSGTMFWNGPSLAGAAPNGPINNPITILAGTMVLQWSPSELNNPTWVNNGLLQYNAPGQSQTYNGAISGVGTNQVSAGTLTLKGASTYTGPDLLSGGEMVAAVAENFGVSSPLGVGGTITFGGGTLGWSVVNTYDYSPRFDTNANQQYSFDTAGQNVTLTNTLASTGGTLTKLGAGTLTISGANTYSGLTTVSAGKLQIQGSAGNGNITVANSAALGTFEGGAQITPGTLTVGTSAGAILEFNNVTSTTTPALASAGGVSAGGPITVNINGGTFDIGQNYPLFSWTTGSAPPVTIGIVIGAGGNLITNGNTISLHVTTLSYVWTGNNNNSWDTTTANNWKLNGVSSIYTNGNGVVFDDTAPGTTNVTLNAPILPVSVILNNNKLQYTVASSGANNIGGASGLTKIGNATATLSGGANTYSGATTINGGILSISALANGGSTSDIGNSANSAANLVLNGGTLQYTGTVAAASDRLFTLGLGGGTLDNEGGVLTLNNAGSIALSGSGARTLNLTGNEVTGDTLAATLGDNGGATAITKLGNGTWILTGNNNNSGVNTILSGVLQVGNGTSGSLGSGPIVDDSGLAFDINNTETVGIVSGTGSVTNEGPGTIILPANNTYVGATVINAGTLQIGNGGASGQLNTAGGAVVDNGTFVFNSTGTCTLGQNNGITGTGNVLVEGNGGTLAAIGPNAYTGWTYIAPGATFQPCKGNSGALTSSVVTNNGELLLVRQDNGVFIYSGNIVGTGFVWKDANNPNVGDVTLTGTNNTYTGGTFINGGIIILGDDTTPGAGSIVGNVTMMFNALNTENSTIEFNRPDTTIFPGVISGYGNLLDNGTGTLILTGNNTYTNSITTINASSILQVGNGGTSGSISVDNVTDNGQLIFNRSDSINVANAISGVGNVSQVSTGTLTLSGPTNSYTGDTIVTSGTLITTGQSSPGVVNIPGNLDVYGGTYVGGGVGTVVSNTIVGTMTISNATVVVSLNKSLAQSNTVYAVTGVASVVAATTPTLSVNNVGPNLIVGDTFTVFNQAVANGNLFTITGGNGATFQNNLAVNGSITVLTAPKLPPHISQISVSGVTLTISATGGVPNGNYVLLGRTNLLTGAWKPIFTNTFNAGGNIVNLSTNIVNPLVPIEFYLLSQ